MGTSNLTEGARPSSTPPEEERGGTRLVHAQRIYNVLFPGDIPAELETRFHHAWQVLAADYSQQEHAEFRAAMRAANDLEALEIACRRRRRLRILTDQVVLMAVLGETLPRHSSFYVQLHAEPLRGLCSLPWCLLRTVWKIVKGTFLVRTLHVK
jgi:hypothetical protein